MAKQQQPQQRRPAAPQPKRPAPAAPAPVRKKESRENLFTAGKDEFIFGRTNFIFLGIGLALVLLGLVTMAGGAMPDPNTWDPNIIYSFRRITLAPIMMVAGFVVVIVGIFKKTASETATEEDNTPAA
jgi:predicted cobalt transporter CbtA